MKKRIIEIKKNESRELVINEEGDYYLELTGEGAQIRVSGALTACGSDSLKIHVVVVHKAKKTSSDIFIRATVKDRARVVLAGLIKVESGSEGVCAFLREDVLLLSERAKAEVIPNLEISTDEVKVSHAATVGRINEEQVFYLRSRGLTKEKAEELISGGFLQEALDRVGQYDI